MSSLQPGDVCFICGYATGQRGAPFNGQVVTLVEYIKNTADEYSGWKVEPKSVIVLKGVRHEVTHSPTNLKPFPKDLLKDEQEDTAPTEKKEKVNSDYTLHNASE